MGTEAHEFVAACQVFARGKTSHHPPAGLLRPTRTVPSRPWSHIVLDFVTGLTPSNGNTTIITVVNRFSKSVLFLLHSLNYLLLRRQLTSWLHIVFCLRGISSNIISDRGPQFISQVWKEFCKALGVTVSVSSGFHPPSNGQTELPTRTWRLLWGT